MPLVEQALIAVEVDGRSDLDRGDQPCLLESALTWVLTATKSPPIARIDNVVYFEVSTLPLVFCPESHLNPGILQDSAWNLTFRRIVDGILPEWCFIYYVLLVRIESHSIP